MSRLQEARRLGQSIWLDYVRRDLITGGHLDRLVREGLGGLTSNPTIFHQAITQGDEYDEAIREHLRRNPGATATTLYEDLTIQDIRMAADALRPVFEATDGADGLVSLEVSPHLAYDTEGTVAEALRLWELVDRPNLMIKVPATPQGFPAIEALIAQGVNVNVTLIFSLTHYEQAARAYIRGVLARPDPGKANSVASLFVSRVDTAVDRLLDALDTPQARALRGKVAVANAKSVYMRYRQIFHGLEFQEARRRGARVQRLLWGSTSTKDPAYSDVKYVDELMGPETVNTLPLHTLEAFQDHGRVHDALNEGQTEALTVLSALEDLGVDLEQVTEQLQRDGVKAFADSYDALLAALETKARAVIA